ncbi:kinase-like domain-containing protein [Aspergillus karnatakaensis]|uniref:kinase-like domain-containing protein n=1 Tax=Aspergillus karnatakaensis TaxID=1810916 RepID=UPI003CCD160C
MEDQMATSPRSYKSRSRSLSVASSSPSTRILALRVVEPLDYYSKRRFHPVHLMDTFQGIRYSVIRKLGYGSFSTVWLARDARLNRYVALKIGQAESSPTGETGIYRRLAETMLTSHPGRLHYLPLLDDFRIVGPNGVHQALVYEPMGASVTEVKDTLFPNGPFPLWTAKSILWQTLLGLDFLLANGVVHGDVQPRNLLFCLDNLTDRPLAELCQDQDIPLTPVSDVLLEGGVRGPKYLVPADSLMQYLDISRPLTIKISDLGGSFLSSQPPSSPAPPLHLRGPETLFQRCISSKQDMWSFGCLIFEFITGITLFDLCDYPVTGITDDMHFIDMYSILGFPESQQVRDRQWPAWGKFFGPNGQPYNHYTRRRDRDLDVFGASTSYTLESLLEEALGEGFPQEELETTKHLLRGLLDFDPVKRFTTKQVMQHAWFSEQRNHSHKI